MNEPRLFSYVLKKDNGSAPNPFWGMCTLTICKPKIRKKAKKNDWVVGTGSKRVRLEDGSIKKYSNYLVYAMKVDGKKLLRDYDTFCKNKLKKKIPKFFNREDFRLRLGDCIYDYSNGPIPILRKSIHKDKQRERDLSGVNALMSKHFYYFGDHPVIIPSHLRGIIKKGPGHKKIENPDLIAKFTNWISQYKINKLYGAPQLKYKFVVNTDNDFEIRKRTIK